MGIFDSSPKNSKLREARLRNAAGIEFGETSVRLGRADLIRHRRRGRAEGVENPHRRGRLGVASREASGNQSKHLRCPSSPASSRPPSPLVDAHGANRRRHSQPTSPHHARHLWPHATRYVTGTLTPRPHGQHALAPSAAPKRCGKCPSAPRREPPLVSRRKPRPPT